MLYYVKGNVFEFQYSLAHCISSDARMSRGVAKDFVDNFSDLNLLKVINSGVGLAVPIWVENRYIYNLVTKSYIIQSLHLKVLVCL